MERNDWNNRSGYGDDRSHRYRGSEPRADEDSYRGAYRLDTTSEDRNKTTWDGFNQGSDRNRRQDTDYNQDYNRNYNNDYNRNYNSDQRRNRGESFREDDYSRDSRYQYQDRSGNSRNWDEQYQSTSGGYGTRFGGSGSSNRHDSVHDRIQDRDRYGAGNFNADYRPDNYRDGGGANYGNMAGSLSFGYDGGNNSDQDRNKWYDPQSGHHRSYHGNYESRHPEREQHRDNRNRSGSNDKGWL